MRTDLQLITDWVPQGARVIDLGCGEGALLRTLREEKNIQGMGIEIDPDNVIACVKNGVNVLQSNIEQGLGGFADQSFDVAVLSQTIQAIHTTEHTLREMARVARELIITLPNFGYWKQRLQLLWGRMPVSKALPYQWFDTPNVRYCTIDDFDVLCGTLGLNVLERIVLDGANQKINILPNFLGAVALYRLSRH